MKNFLFLLVSIFILTSCTTTTGDDKIKTEVDKEIPAYLELIDLSEYTLVKIETLDPSVTDSIEYVEVTLDENILESNTQSIINSVYDKQFDYGPILGENPILKLRYQNGSKELEISFYKHTVEDRLKGVSFKNESSNVLDFVYFEHDFTNEYSAIYYLLN